MIARRLDREVRKQSAEVEGDPDRIGQPAQRHRPASLGAEAGGSRQRVQPRTGNVIDLSQIDHQAGLPAANRLSDGRAKPAR